MKIFVSYTCRDGLVTERILRDLHKYLSGVCNPFIHIIEQPKLHWQQFSVVLALLFSDMILFINSPQANQSKWVRFELSLGRFLRHPIIQLDIHDITPSSHTEINSNIANTIGI